MAVRSRNTPLRSIAVGFVCALIFSSCTDSADNSTAPVASGAGLTDATVTAPATETTAATTIAVTTVLATTTTTTSTTTSTTSTTIAPVATIPHGNGPLVVAVDGTPLAPEVSATAKQIYDAAVIRDYAAIKAIIGDRRFRWGFVGQRRPAEEWQKEFDEGGPDALARIVALLDLAPAIDKRGNTVWPYLATKDPAEWDDQDLGSLASLGYRPEDVAATKFKGVYKDFRLIIGPDGVWTAFGVGY